MNDIIEKLKSVRKVPRQMHKSYLQKIGVYDYIIQTISNDFKIKDKIDIILDGKFTICKTCKTNLAKPASDWCCHTCRNKDIDFRKHVGAVNKANKVSRANKMKNTLLEKYGVSAIQDIPSVKKEARNKKLKYYDTIEANRFDILGLNRDILSDHILLKKLCNTYPSYSELSAGPFNNMSIMGIWRFFNKINFDPGFCQTQSKGEREISKFLLSLNIAHECNDRKLISPLELDIIIPSCKLAIEYNGLHYHSGLEMDYHSNKTTQAKQRADYQLIHVFEDEWEFKQDIVKSIIKTKCSLYEEKYFARELKFKSVNTKDAKIFLDNTHIQGFINGKHYGLYTKSNELISLITVGTSRFKRKEIELYRYSTKLNTQVIGGFTKLISNYKKISGNNKILTFADLRYFNGDVYKKFGEYIHTSKPNYWWTKSNMQRIPRYQTQKHKLAKFLGDSFNVELTENQNMENAGYKKIYDCGNMLFVI